MERLSKINERLKELLIESNKNSKDLAALIGVNNSAIRKWLLYDVNIELKNLLKLADFFKCSIEYLIGRSENPKEVEPVQCAKFYDRFKIILYESGKNTYKIDKETKIKYMHLYRWEKGAEPKLSSLIEVSNYLECSIDYLVGRE